MRVSSAAAAAAAFFVKKWKFFLFLRAEFAQADSSKKGIRQ